MKNKLFLFLTLFFLNTHLTANQWLTYADDVDADDDKEEAVADISNGPVLSAIANILESPEINDDNDQEYRKLLAIFESSLIDNPHPLELLHALTYLSNLESQILLLKLWDLDSFHDIEKVKLLKNSVIIALERAINVLHDRNNYLESFIQVPNEEQPASSSEPTIAERFGELRINSLPGVSGLPVLNEQDQEAFLLRQNSLQTIVPSDFKQTACPGCDRALTPWVKHNCSQRNFLLFNQSNNNN